MRMKTRFTQYAVLGGLMAMLIGAAFDQMPAAFWGFVLTLAAALVLEKS